MTVPATLGKAARRAGLVAAFAALAATGAAAPAGAQGQVLIAPRRAGVHANPQCRASRRGRGAGAVLVCQRHIQGRACRVLVLRCHRIFQVHDDRIGPAGQGLGMRSARVAGTKRAARAPRPIAAAVALELMPRACLPGALCAIAKRRRWT